MKIQAKKKNKISSYITDIVKKIDYKKNKKIIFCILAVFLLLITSIIGYNIVTGNRKKDNNKNSKNKIINYTDDGSTNVILNFNSNKIKSYDLEIKKGNEKILSKKIIRENNELTKTVSIKEELYKHGFGFYQIKVMYKTGIFNKAEKSKLNFTKIHPIKNVEVVTNYYKGLYNLKIEHTDDIKKYEIRLQNGEKVESFIREVTSEDSSVINLDITNYISKMGYGTYTVQVDNIVNDYVRGIPKIFQFTAKKVIEKPKANIITTDLNKKILKIEKNESVYEYEVSISSNQKMISSFNVKSEFNITDYLYKNKHKEGFYEVKVKPLVASDNLVVSENVENSSVYTFNNVTIDFKTPDVKHIKANNTVLNNRPQILIDNLEYNKYNYYIEVKSKNINKIIDYKLLEENGLDMLGGKYFLAKEDIEKLESDEKVVVNVYKENITTKEKTYPYTKTLVKKQNTSLISFGYLELEN